MVQLQPAPLLPPPFAQGQFEERRPPPWLDTRGCAMIADCMESAGHRLLGRDAAVAALVVLVVLLVQLPARLCGVNLLDEGAILQTADDLRRGLRLYVDAVHLPFPGIFYLTAWAFALGGTSMSTARTLAALVFAAAAGVVYLIARWSHSRAGALAVVLAFVAYRVWAYPHWHIVNYSPLAVLLLLLAAWIVGEGLAGRGRWPFVLAGVVSGAAVLAKQDSGIAVSGALALALLVCQPATGRRRALAGFAGGAAAVAILVALWISASGMAREF